MGTACRTWEGFHVPLAGQCPWGEASLALWSAGTAPESTDLEARRLRLFPLFLCFLTDIEETRQAS